MDVEEISCQLKYYFVFIGDGHEERLQGFVINTYDENRARIGYYEDRSGLRNVLIYFINLNGNVNDTVNFISIRLNGEQKILTLCEVEAYGGK